MTDLPQLLTLTRHSESLFGVTHPTETAEGRDVVYSGQLLAQMMMASDAVARSEKRVRSVHAVFARAGTYTQPIDLEVESMHAGRTWASDTVTARQDGRLLCRSLVLLDSDDQDLMRHEPPMPVDVPDPEDVVAGDGLVYPGAEWRPVPGEALINDVPTAMAWHRFAPAAGGSTAHRAVLAWATCGDVISTGMRPHRSGVDISQAHRTLSTGVIAHTIHFTDDLDVGDWHLVVTRADKAGGGRIFGTGQVFDVRGRLVAAFSQDSMAKRAAQTLDPSSKM